MSDLDLISSADNPNEIRNMSSAVLVHNLSKSYNGNVPVISNLCMEVQNGTIYGLIGSSGCGKTTLLSCLVGLQTWESGRISVLGRSPKLIDNTTRDRAVGYMPQELALQNCLTIFELFMFYGRLYKMTKSRIQEQYAKLHELFELPDATRNIINLSGGQKRRVSLALAMMHSPKLLILDEPTVGMDPLLREKVWKHFCEVTKAGDNTIVITTHYIEESKCSDKIGIMRGGRLLVEASPQVLLDSFQSDSLEKVVLKLCKLDDTMPEQRTKLTNFSRSRIPLVPQLNSGQGTSTSFAQTENSVLVNKATTIEIPPIKPPKRNESLLNVYFSELLQKLVRIYSYTLVLLLLVIRYKPFLVILLLLPALQGSIVMLTIAYPPIGLNLGVVNLELRNNTKHCDADLNTKPQCDLSSLSCTFLNTLETSGHVVLNYFENQLDAHKEVNSGKSWGYLLIPSTYSESTADVLVSKQFALNQSLEGSRISVFLDNSNFLVSYYMSKHIYGSFFKYSQLIAKSCNFISEELQIPLVFRSPVYGGNEGDNSPFIMPGFIICSSICVMCGLSGLTFIGDCKEKIVSRTHVAGLKFSEIQLSYLVAQGIITVIQTVIWYFVLHYGFGFVILGSPVLCLFICLLVGLCGTAIGILVAVGSKSEVDVAFIGTFLNINLMLFGGVFFPPENMSLIWQKVGLYLPTTLVTRSLVSIVVRGYGITHSLVWPGVVIIVLWTLVIFALNSLIYRRCSYK